MDPEHWKSPWEIIVRLECMGSDTGEDRVPRGLALDEERLDRAGPGHLQAAREVPQSPGKRERS